MATSLISGKKKSKSHDSVSKKSLRTVKTNKSTATADVVDKTIANEGDQTFTFQIVSQCIQMAGSLGLMKLTLESKSSMQISRLVFAAYVLLSSFVYWLIEEKIKGSDDSRLSPSSTPTLPANIPFRSLATSMLETVAVPEDITIREYDRGELKRLIFGLLSEAVITLVVHHFSKKVIAN